METPVKQPSQMKISLPSPPTTKKRARPSCSLFQLDDTDDIQFPSSNSNSTSIFSNYSTQQHRQYLLWRARHRASLLRKNHQLQHDSKDLSSSIKLSSLNSNSNIPNGNSNHSSSSSPTLWRKLKDANRKLENIPRVDPRFVPNTRPLDRLNHFQTSIVISLFPDGYVRHDSMPILSNGQIDQDIPNSNRHLNNTTPSKQNNNNKTNNIHNIPRHPYDRYARRFFRFLDLGLIPPADELPELSQRHYDEGCLIAEINDFRQPAFGTSGKLNTDSHCKILLRPHLSSIYEDLHNETYTSNANIARLAEERIINAINLNFSLDPTPQININQLDNDIRSNPHPINIFRAPKRRKITHHRRITSSQALTGAAAVIMHNVMKQKRKLLTYQTSPLTGKETVANPKNISVPNPSAFATSVANQKLSRNEVSSPRAPTIENPNKIPQMSQQPALAIPSLQRLPKPPREIMFEACKSLQSPNMLGTPAQAKAIQSIAVGSRAERRMMTLVKVDDILDPALMVGQSQADRERLIQQKLQQNPSKPGTPVVYGSLIRSQDKKTCEVTVTRQAGEKSREHSRIRFNSVKEGHMFLSHLNKIAGREGYICIRDLYSNDMQRLQQRKQQQQRLQQQAHMLRPSDPNIAHQAAQAQQVAGRSIPRAQSQARAMKNARVASESMAAAQARAPALARTGPLSHQVSQVQRPVQGRRAPITLPQAQLPAAGARSVVHQQPQKKQRHLPIGQHPQTPQEQLPREDSRNLDLLELQANSSSSQQHHLSQPSSAQQQTSQLQVSQQLTKQQPLPQAQQRRQAQQRSQHTQAVQQAQQAQQVQQQIQRNQQELLRHGLPTQSQMHHGHLQDQRSILRRRQQLNEILQNPDKGNLNGQQIVPGLMNSPRISQGMSKGLNVLQRNPQVSRAEDAAVALRTAGISGMPNGAMINHNLVPQVHLQLQEAQSQGFQSREAPHQFMALSGHTNSNFVRAGNMGANSVQDQQIADVFRNAAAGMGAMNNQNGAGAMGNSDGMVSRQLPAQFKHQRENVEARGGKR